MLGQRVIADSLPKWIRFSLDFHTIPHRGNPSVLENQFVAKRGKAEPSIIALFAQEHESRVLCYANANLLRTDQSQEPIAFVDFWRNLTGINPKWLYFDSKLVPYSVLNQLDEQNISFVTIRRKGASLVQRVKNLNQSEWCKATIDIPKRRHQSIFYHEEQIRLKGYNRSIRQLIVRGLGREIPTFFISNNFEQTARDLIVRYAQRNRIEDGIGTSVNFFHLDCLASEVRLNVDLDVALTVLANDCYRWLATQLRGFDRAAPKQLFRRFVETAGKVEIGENHIRVYFEKRSHIPIVQEARLDRDELHIPWLGNKRLLFSFS